MSDAPKVYQLIISKLKDEPLAVFDLDSTLFNVSHRTQNILNTFLDEHAHLSHFQNDIHQVRQVRIEHRDWGLKEAFLRHQLELSNPFISAVRDYWKKHFFSSHFLHHDRPYEGAVDYVNALARAGVKVCYLTGRDSLNMREGTIRSLEQWGLPIDDVDRDLIMKPSKGSVEDDEFKNQEMKKLKSAANHIWFFENEPLIVHRILKSAPDVNIVWIDTTHSRRAEPPTDLHIIQDRWSTK